MPKRRSNKLKPSAPKQESRISRRTWLQRGALGACAVGGLGALALASHRILGQERPNIILITLDTTRPDHLGCYGYAKPTSPSIDRFAEQAVVYDRAESTGTWTLPAHASLFTGKFISSHGAQHDPEGSLRITQGIRGPESWNVYRARTIAPDEITLADQLSEAGYETGGVAAGPWLKKVFGLNQGFRFYDDDQIDAVNGRLATDVTDTALRWLDKPVERPRFLFLNYFDPHGPLMPPDEFARRFAPVWPYPLEKLKEAPPEQLLGLYDAEIAYMDRHVGRLFEGLKQRGLYDDAWIIITADHGELWGEHGEKGHGQMPYREVTRIPLIIKEPGGQPATGRKDHWIQLVDIMPMILDRLNLSIPNNVQGDVPPYIKHPILIESRTLPQLYPGGNWLAWIQDEMKFFFSSQGRHMLFDLKADPSESQNLYAARPQDANTLNDNLIQYVASLPGPGAEGQSRKVDAETVEALRGLGYLK